MSDIYCNYCYKTWKLKLEYDKHIACCEYFHNLRKTPQMESYAGKIPTLAEVLKLVEHLATKVEKQEKEIARLKTCVNAKQKRVILDWLNSPSQTPLQSFEEWWHLIVVNHTHLQHVFKYDLTEGIKMAIETYLATYGKTRLPIRSFTQKQNLFYVYSTNDDKTLSWKIMSNAELETMVIYLSQLFLREFLKWQKDNATDLEENEDKKEQELMYMIKINGMKMSLDKRAGELKKWLFPLLEENLKTVDVEFD
jgi:hypothetical protein